ncbi:DNA polymerase zeta [Linnemannia zychae]|nr:DNA polymerase zeta [Linnemannia zychae]
MQPQEPESSQFRVPEGPARKAQQPQSGTASPTKAESSSTITTSKTTTTVSVSKTTITTSSSATDQATDNFRVTSETPHKFRGVPQYVKPTASQVEHYDNTQTQMLGDFTQDLSDDEQQEGAQEAQLPFGRMVGAQQTLTCHLTRAQDSYTFGISQKNDFTFNHQHWPSKVKEAQDTWFRLSWKPSSGNPNQVLTTIHGVSPTGVYVNGKLLSKGKSQLIQWGNTVAGGPDGELFMFTYQEIKRAVKVETARATYELEDAQIGKGQYATVHRARDTAHNDMMYACKVINLLAREYNEREREGIAFEINLLQELSHENIVKFIEVHSAGHMTYIFTELIDGETLHTYYQKREPPKLPIGEIPGLSEEEARNIFRQTCDAVCYLHSLNVVHRDIKSENVMVTADGVVKLIDFGLARHSTSKDILNTFCGTEAYMAPETYYGEETNGYGKAIDVWSLGIMLFRMLAGSYPFETRKYENGDNANKDGSAEAQGDGIVKTDEETNMQGVERQAKPHQGQPPPYQRDWRPFVDNVRLRSNEVKDLLGQMLTIDPSKRISITAVLRHDWTRMIKEELIKIEEALSAQALDSVLKPKPEVPLLWIELNIVQGSVPDAPRRIGLMDKENEAYLGRDPYMVGVHLGSDTMLSSVHCRINREVEENVVMVYDMSENGTYINAQKIGLGRGLQLLDGDELGCLKYKVKLRDSKPTAVDRIRRRYVVDDKAGPKTERCLIRKGGALDIPPTNDFPTADNAWGKLEPINSNSAKEILSLKKNVIGRWLDCDVIIANNLISRYHCVFEWNEEHRAAYLSSMAQNVVKVNGARVQGHMQLRDEDVIHLASPKSPRHSQKVIHFSRHRTGTFIHSVLITSTFVMDSSIKVPSPHSSRHRLPEEDSFRGPFTQPGQEHDQQSVIQLGQQHSLAQGAEASRIEADSGNDTKDALTIDGEEGQEDQEHSIHVVQSSRKRRFKNRIADLDYSMVPPGPLDLQSCQFLPPHIPVQKVPVVRIFGANEAGQKTCVHIHQVYPYFYVQYKGSLEPAELQLYIHQLGVSLNHAAAITFNTPPQDLRKSQYVAAITPVKGIPFYGYHVGYSYFLKIYLFNPDFENRIVELMRSGAVMRTEFQPFEAHIPFRLQFFIDYNLYGMGWLELEDALMRNPVPAAAEGDHPKRLTKASVMDTRIWSPENDPGRISSCEIEMDTTADRIINRDLAPERDSHFSLEECFKPPPSTAQVPSVAGLWEDDVRRRKANNLPSQEAPKTQLREPESIPWINNDLNKRMVANLVKEIVQRQSQEKTPTQGDFDNYSTNQDPLARSLVTAYESVEFLCPRIIPESDESSRQHTQPHISRDTSFVIDESESSIYVDESIIQSQAAAKFSEDNMDTRKETFKGLIGLGGIDEQDEDEEDFPLPDMDLGDFQDEDFMDEAGFWNDEPEASEPDSADTTSDDGPGYQTDERPDRQMEEDFIPQFDGGADLDDEDERNRKQETDEERWKRITIRRKRGRSKSSNIQVPIEQSPKAKRFRDLDAVVKGSSQSSRGFEEVVDDPIEDFADNLVDSNEVKAGEVEDDGFGDLPMDVIVDNEPDVIILDSPPPSKSRLDSASWNRDIISPPSPRHNYFLSTLKDVWSSPSPSPPMSQTDFFQSPPRPRSPDLIPAHSTPTKSMTPSSNSSRQTFTSLSSSTQPTSSATSRSSQRKRSSGTFDDLSIINETVFPRKSDLEELLRERDIKRRGSIESGDSPDHQLDQLESRDKFSSCVLVEDSIIVDEIESLTRPNEECPPPPATQQHSFPAALDHKSPMPPPAPQALPPQSLKKTSYNSYLARALTSGHGALDSQVYQFSIPPPTLKDLMSSLPGLGLPNRVHQKPHFSNEADVPSRAKVFGGKEFRLQSKGLKSMPLFRGEFDRRGNPCPGAGYQYWEPNTRPPSYAEAHTWLKEDDERVKASLRSRAEASTQQRRQKVSQIEGPTQKNPFGCKTTPTKVAGSIAIEKDFLDVLSLEVHCQTRGALLPDPKFDPILAVFYCWQTDREGLVSNGWVPGFHVGIITYENSGMLEKLALGPLGVSIEVKADEEAMLNAVIDRVRQSDPDILAGYEVHNLSWGYLVDRYQKLFSMDMTKLISRIVPLRPPYLSKSAMEAQNSFNSRKNSGLKIVGRHVFNVWRLIRGEVALTNYGYCNVVFHVLQQRIPHYSFETLTKWWADGSALHQCRVVKNYIHRVQYVLQLIESQELISRTSEFARVFGVDFFSVISRGSQYKVESLMVRLSKPENYIMISPSRAQVGAQRAAEVIPMVMEPESGFYEDPVVVLDFQSLYPSVMIAYNYCYSTCLGKLGGGSQIGVVKDYVVQDGILPLMQEHLQIAPNHVMYVNQEIRRSLLARMLSEILETRVMVKKAMKDYPNNKSLLKLLDARQLSLKFIANVTYGYTCASFSGRMPGVEIADSIVLSARETLERSIRFVNENPKWDARVVYGDTDSMFVQLKGRTRQEAFEIGYDISETITKMNPRPVKLKFEKVYHPCFLVTKKRYVGSSYETPEQVEPIFDAKGIETIRRDGVPAVQKIMETCIKTMFRTQDLSLVKSYLVRQLGKILEGRVPVPDLMFGKEVKLGRYSEKGVPPPGAVVSARRMELDPRSEPQYGERVPYVVVYGDPSARLTDQVVEPKELLRNKDLRLNGEYYIRKHVIPSLERILQLAGADVKSWYDEMPRVQKAIPMTALGAAAATGGGGSSSSSSLAAANVIPSEQNAAILAAQHHQVDLAADGIDSAGQGEANFGSEARAAAITGVGHESAPGPAAGPIGPTGPVGAPKFKPKRRRGGKGFVSVGSRIDRYYQSQSCVVCGKLVVGKKAGSDVCLECSSEQNQVKSVFTMQNRLSNAEKQFRAALDVCNSCCRTAPGSAGVVGARGITGKGSSSSLLVGVGLGAGGGVGGDETGTELVACESLECPVFWHRRRAQDAVVVAHHQTERVLKELELDF